MSQVVNPPQQQPTAEDIMKRLRNQIKLAFADGAENALKVLDIYERQITAAAAQINANAALIIKFQEEFKKRKIDISHITNPPKPKEPNRKERRAAEKQSKKSAKKASKKSRKKA